MWVLAGVAILQCALLRIVSAASSISVSAATWASGATIPVVYNLSAPSTSGALRLLGIDSQNQPYIPSYTSISSPGTATLSVFVPATWSGPAQIQLLDQGDAVLQSIAVQIVPIVRFLSPVPNVPYIYYFDVATKIPIPVTYLANGLIGTFDSGSFITNSVVTVKEWGTTDTVAMSFSAINNGFINAPFGLAPPVGMETYTGPVTLTATIPALNTSISVVITIVGATSSYPPVVPYL